VRTFYGVNYVMATAMWAAFELAFLGGCKWRYNVLAARPASPGNAAHLASVQ
jgi:hypothetical protein